MENGGLMVFDGNCWCLVENIGVVVFDGKCQKVLVLVKIAS